MHSCIVALLSDDAHYTIFPPREANLSVAEEEAGEETTEEMRDEDRAEDAEEKIENRARARRVGEERDVVKDGLQAPDEAHVHQVDREEHVVVA